MAVISQTRSRADLFSRQVRTLRTARANIVRLQTQLKRFDRSRTDLLAFVSAGPLVYQNRADRVRFTPADQLRETEILAYRTESDLGHCGFTLTELMEMEPEDAAWFVWFYLNKDISQLAYSKTLLPVHLVLASGALGLAAGFLAA